MIADRAHDIGVRHVVDQRNVLVADSLDVVLAESVFEHGRAFERLHRDDVRAEVVLQPISCCDGSSRSGRRCERSESQIAALCLHPIANVLEHVPDPAAQLEFFADRLQPDGTALLNWYFFKGFQGEYPFHFDDTALVEAFFRTLQRRFLEVFHPWLITARTYRPMAAA